MKRCRIFFLAAVRGKLGKFYLLWVLRKIDWTDLNLKAALSNFLDVFDTTQRNVSLAVSLQLRTWSLQLARETFPTKFSEIFDTAHLETSWNKTLHVTKTPICGKGLLMSCHFSLKKKLGKRTVCFTRDRSKHLVYPLTTWTWLIDLMKLWRPHVDVSHHRRCLGILWESLNRSWSLKLKKDELKTFYQIELKESKAGKLKLTTML